MKGLAEHLTKRYGIEVVQLTQLDQEVFRVERRDGPDWVARAFTDRPESEVEDDAAVLRGLDSAGFPAERCAHLSPVSRCDGRTVLVTEWVEGRRSDGRGRTFGVLGALLGALHARSGESLRPGGAWHHLSPSGGPREEIDVAIRQFEAADERVPPGLSALYDRVRDALEELDDGHDLPQAFVHPDFVPVNAITTADDGRVIVDWSGAGRGPRLWSLALLLWAGGMRSLRLVDLAITRYARHVELEDGELERLAGVIPARPLTMNVWSFCRGRVDLREVYHGLQYNREAAERITDQVRTSLDRRRL